MNSSSENVGQVCELVLQLSFIVVRPAHGELLTREKREFLGVKLGGFLFICVRATSFRLRILFAKDTYVEIYNLYIDMTLKLHLQ